MSEDAPKRPWEEDFGPEEEFLYAHGFHRHRKFEDLWQYGSDAARAADAVDEVNVYTRQQAFEQIAKRMDRHE
jgi:predicted metal-dependent phosphoesterase TrpH